jgi:hypothetical protein
LHQKHTFPGNFRNTPAISDDGAGKRRLPNSLAVGTKPTEPKNWRKQCVAFSPLS